MTVADSGFTGASGSSEGAVVAGSFASEFERIFSTSSANIRPGKVVSGTVVGINKEVATVDIGFKSDGAVPLGQFAGPDGKPVVAIGDNCDVYILSLENDMGQVVLSKERADQKRVWEGVEKAFRDDGTIRVL